MLLIIFGAGASYDYAENSIDGNHLSLMPLANQLIDNDHLPEAGEAMDMWPGSVPILNDLKKLAKQQGFSIEEALFDKLQKNNDDIRAQLLSFVFFVHRVLGKCETEVRKATRANTNYTLLFMKLQDGNYDRTMKYRLVSFNYDTLIETGLKMVYPRWNPDTLADYMSAPHGIKLYKPHGSLNWQTLTSVSHSPHRRDVIQQLTSMPNRFTQASIQVVPYFENYPKVINESGPLKEPRIALPYKEKTEFVFPADQLELLCDEIEEISHILTIGWQGAEQHFHREVMSRIPSDSRVKILNVNPMTSIVEANLQQALGDRIDRMETFTEGFTGFIQDQSRLETFLES